MSLDSPTLPAVLAGPILRQCGPHRLSLWLAVSQPLAFRLQLFAPNAEPRELIFQPGEPGCQSLKAGARLHHVLLDWRLDSPLPLDVWVGYELSTRALGLADAAWQSILSENGLRCYPGKTTLGFVLGSRIRSLLHGSCRKPHHPGGDGLAQADRLLSQLVAQNRTDSACAPSSQQDLPDWPSLLMLTGDQIYADDVAGPMLLAIHQVVALLGLPDERLPLCALPHIKTAQALYADTSILYRRESLLPQHPDHQALLDVLFGGVKKPIFTTDSAHNHLITLGEVLAMYALVWSPALWPLLDLSPPASLPDEFRQKYANEQQALAAFCQDLSAVQRLLAHLPTAMIFDDHDITDDWNLSREWEEVAYGHPFSRRVIGNALLGYWLHQGWGNRSDAFDAAWVTQAQAALDAGGQSAHDDFIDQLLRFDQWHFTWPTQPPLVVMDSRTHRWRSELAARQPSGLMDWESLSDLQHSLKGLPNVVLVSPTPVFGVKFIETIQRIFTWWGQPLMVDAENWMAHRGAAHAMMNLFRHPKTPQRFVILSGDVHYSFVYDVEMRGRLGGPDIWQICSSGLRNTFPNRLLHALDVLNRWLYAPRSPLNWFTRRRRMKVTPRKPEGMAHGRRLLNGSGIGWVELDDQGTPWRIRQWLADGQSVAFARREAESRWD